MSFIKMKHYFKVESTLKVKKIKVDTILRIITYIHFKNGSTINIFSLYILILKKV